MYVYLEIKWLHILEDLTHKIWRSTPPKTGGQLGSRYINYLSYGSGSALQGYRLLPQETGTGKPLTTRQGPGRSMAIGRLPVSK